MTIRKRTWTTKAGITMNCWYIDIKFRHPDGHIQRVRQASPVNTKRGAQRYELEVRAALLDGTFGKEQTHDQSEPTSVPTDVPSLGVFAGEFIENYALVNNKPSSVESKQTILKHHLVPFFGPMRLDRIGPKQIERYKASKFRTHSKKSINNQLTVLRKLLAVACEWGYVTTVPKVKWVKAPKPDFRFLDFEQTAALLEAAEPEPQWHAMILLAVRTGLRQGELLALRWRDVDLASGQLVVRQAVARGIVGTPKGGRPREIPLTASALQALKAHRHLRSELVFCQPDGSMLTKGQCKWPLIRAKRRAELVALGWHDLRHTFASHMVMRGAPLKAVQELLGHTTIEMTMRYAHLSRRAMQEAVDLLETELGHTRGTWTGAKTNTGS